MSNWLGGRMGKKGKKEGKNRNDKKTKHFTRKISNEIK